MEIVEVTLKTGEVFTVPGGTWYTSMLEMGYTLDDIDTAFAV
jgi:predicted secreted protein